MSQPGPHGNRENEAGYVTLLQNVAPAATHDSIDVVDSPKCHPGTRVAIIRSIIDWADGVADEKINQKSIIWLNGGAGAGKSAIARSVASRWDMEGLLLGSFFFAAGDATRNHVGGLVATLCYQMCRILPEFRHIVLPLIANDPLIFNDRSISSQLTTLVINPLSTLILVNGQSGPTRIPRLVVIDGLDECIKNIDRKDLLFSLHQATCSMPYIRFLVCSRPEKDINDIFSEPPYMANDLYKIVLGDYPANEDIRLYLEDMFKTIKDCHHHKHTLPTTWPAPKMIDDLVEGSSGQFIYASTVIRYVESTRHRPHQRLDAIFNLRPPFKDLPFTELDTQVYRNVISKAADPSKVLDILAFPLLYGNTFPITVIEVILQVERGDGELMLADIQSVVAVGGARRMIFLNKPFSGFLSDHQRAGDFYRDPSAVSLQHIAHTITAFSIPFLPRSGLWGRSGYLTVNSPEVVHLMARENHQVLEDIFRGQQSTEPISSDILQAARKFPMVEFIRGLLRSGAPTGANPNLPRPIIINHIKFLTLYFNYLFRMALPSTRDKLSLDDLEATMLINTEQINQYCEGVLSALENDWSDNGQAHFVYVFYHLLPGMRHWHGLLRMRNLFVNLHDRRFRGANVFGDPISRIMCEHRGPWKDGGKTVQKTSYELTKGVKQEEIFAKLSAIFCLAPLCDEQRTRRDTRRISRIMGTDPYKRRERPWRWRQWSHRAGRSLHNGLGNGMGIAIQTVYGMDKLKVIPVRLGRQGKSYRKLDCFDSIFTIPEYLSYYRRNPRPDLWKIKTSSDAGKQGGPRRYMHLLELLPHILPLSGRYEPLVTMCRKKCFASITQFWPKKSKRARQAIEAYLQRVDPQANSSEGKNPGLLKDASQSMVSQELDTSEGKTQEDIQPFDVRAYARVLIIFLSVLVVLSSAFIVIS